MKYKTLAKAAMILAFTALSACNPDGGRSAPMGSGPKGVKTFCGGSLDMSYIAKCAAFF